MAKLPSLKDDTQELLDAAEDAWNADSSRKHKKRRLIPTLSPASRNGTMLENIIERSEDNEFHT